MSCLTTSATLRSRRDCAAVLIADAAASSHESLLVPISSVTRYTLTRAHSLTVVELPQHRSHPLDSPLISSKPPTQRKTDNKRRTLCVNARIIWHRLFTLNGTVFE